MLQTFLRRWRRPALAAVFVCFVLSSPVWLAYGFAEYAKVFPTASVRVENNSGEVISNGRFAAFGRIYEFGPVETGRAKTLPVIAPEEHGSVRLTLNFASGKALDAEDFWYAPWFNPHIYTTSGNGVASSEPGADRYCLTARC